MNLSALWQRYQLFSPIVSLIAQFMNMCNNISDSVDCWEHNLGKVGPGRSLEGYYNYTPPSLITYLFYILLEVSNCVQGLNWLHSPSVWCKLLFIPDRHGWYSIFLRWLSSCVLNESTKIEDKFLISLGIQLNKHIARRLNVL